MTFFDSANFTCNVCGKVCERSAANFGREVPSCPHCGSTVRARGLVAMLSREIFGVELAMPDFPLSKGLRGIGMSDPAELAAGFAEKFAYTNTFYHQAPLLDITQPAEQDLGRYDFIVSCEVMEHVPPPVERAFVNLYRMLKPDGLLLLTVPYRATGLTTEHFPELNEYTLASLGGRVVLVNRRRDGSTEVFEDLCFHGGDGSTVEMRVFSEESLKNILREAGFSDVRIAAGNVPQFGVNHTETWSLPIVARKGNFKLPTADLAAAYRDATRKLAAVRAEHRRDVEFHAASHREMEQALSERLEWVRTLERNLEERTQWALSLKDELERTRLDFARHADFHASSHQEMERALAERTQWALSLKDELEKALAEFSREVSSREEMEHALAERLEWVRKLEREFEERTQWALALQKEKDEALAAFRREEAARTRLEARLWARIGRKLGFLS